MKKFLLRKSLTIGLFLITSLVIESYLFVFLGLGIFPEYIMFDIALLLFFSFIIFCLPAGRFQNIFVCSLVLIQIILSYINICMYQTLSDIFTFDLLSLVGETARVITWEMLPVWPMVFYLVLFGLFLTAILFLKKIDVRKFRHNELVKFVIKNIAIVGLTLCFVLYSVTSEFIIKSREEDEELYFFSDIALYNTFSSNKQALAKFGTWGFYFEEFFRQFYTIDDTARYTKAELNAYLDLWEYDPKKLSTFGACEGQNVVMIMMESFEWYAISPELTPTLYALAKGYDFGTLEDGYKNFNFYDFVKEDGDTFTTLLRKDYTYEDGEYTKIDDVDLFEDTTLFDNYGYTLVNYYSKSKTDYSETSSILGNYPYNESFTTHGGILGYDSQNLYSNIDYCFSLPNMLKDNEVVEVANYMHSYNSTFYGRDTLIKQFGFDYTKFLDGMSDEISKGDRLSHATIDSEVMEYYLSESNDYRFIPEDKSFLSFYTSVTTHGEYTENPLLSKHYEFLDSIDYLGKHESGKQNSIGLTAEQEGYVRTYLASALDTEYMVTILVDYLMKNGLFDDTTIVLFSDHQSYYDQMDLYYKSAYFSDKSGEFSSPIYWERDTEYGENYGIDSQDRYKVPAIIYSTRLDNAVVGGSMGHYVTKLTCAFDLPVTIMCLLGVEYNPAMYLGYPVKCIVYNEQTELYRDLGVPAICSATGSVFDLYINTEEGKTLKYNKSNVVIPDDLTKFSYNVIKYVEKWYKITALYQYDMFGKE